MKNIALVLALASVMVFAACESKPANRSNGNNSPCDHANTANCSNKNVNVNANANVNANVNANANIK